MARSDKRYSVYPNPQSVAEVGSTSPQLNAAIDRYALLARLMRAPDETQTAVWAIVQQMLDATGAK